MDSIRRTAGGSLSDTEFTEKSGIRNIRSDSRNVGSSRPKPESACCFAMALPKQPPRPPRGLDDELAALEALLDARASERERAGRADSTDGESPPPDRIENQHIDPH